MLAYLKLCDVFEAVVAHELEEPVRGHAPGMRDAHPLDERVAPPLLPQDVLGEEQPGGLAADLPVALRRADDACQQPAEVVDA